MDYLDPLLIAQMRSRCRLLIGQIAAKISDPRVRAGYHLVVSAVPSMVERFRRLGVDAEWLPHAFDPTVLDRVGDRQRDVPVSFVGSMFDVHATRAALISEVADQAEVHVWTSQRAAFGGRSSSRIQLHPAVWGRDMFGVLASSVVTLNIHGSIGEGAPFEAANLRLFEATGMGALLVTDRMHNLGDLFLAGREVVDYSDPREAASVVRYYVEHPAEGAEIAAAGQTRTLRDHTWIDRMRRLIAMIEKRL